MRIRREDCSRDLFEQFDNAVDSSGPALSFEVSSEIFICVLRSAWRCSVHRGNFHCQFSPDAHDARQSIWSPAVLNFCQCSIAIRMICVEGVNWVRSIEPWKSLSNTDDFQSSNVLSLVLILAGYSPAGCLTCISTRWLMIRFTKAWFYCPEIKRITNLITFPCCCRRRRCRCPWSLI